MLPVIVHVIRKNGQRDKLPCWALVDSGSNVDCIRADIAVKLGIETFEVMTKLTTLSEPTSEIKRYCNFYISNIDETGGFDVFDAMLANNFQGQNERPPRNADIADLKYLVDAGVTFKDIGSEVLGVLLSTKKAWVWEGGDVVKGDSDMPMAKNTPLGWLLFGGENTPSSSSTSTNLCIDSAQTVEDKFDLLLRREFLTSDGKLIDPLKKHMSVEDKLALQQVQSTLIFDDRLGKYTCNLPLKWSRERTIEILKNIDSKANAHKRLMNGISKMVKEPERAEATDTEIKKMLTNNWCRKLEDGEGRDWRPSLLHSPPRSQAGETKRT